MNSKLQIRNLSSSITENDLRKLFAQCGTVVIIDLIKDRATRRSKGYGFIQMSSPLEAENAVEMFNGRRLDDNEIRVSFAQRDTGRSRVGNGQKLSVLIGGRNNQRLGTKA
jgi:RNA recognition motif-containing protein